jgi:hypothetical protein
MLKNKAWQKLRKKKRRSSVKGPVLMIVAALVLLTYPLGVAWTFLASDAPGVSVGSRLWHAMGWPLTTFAMLMGKASAYMPALTEDTD